MEIEGEQAYPIYSFAAKWIEDGDHDPKYIWMHEGLPEGRIWNTTVEQYCMFRQEMTPSELHHEADQLWTKYIEARAEKHPSDWIVTVLFVRYETWCGSWFQHWTFDVGQSDKEALASFGRFVCRMTPLCNRHRELPKDQQYCLMGAEDRRRWCGSGEDGDPNTRTNPPCRCRYCKEQGVIRIGH